MQVYVIYLLVGTPTVVEDGSVAVRQSFIRRDLLRHQEEMPDERLVLFGQVVERGYDLARHDEDMYRGLGVDVPQNGAPVILIEDLTVEFSLHDFLKQRLTGLPASEIKEAPVGYVYPLTHRTGAIQDFAYEFPRRPLLEVTMNRGNDRTLA